MPTTRRSSHFTRFPAVVSPLYLVTPHLDDPGLAQLLGCTVEALVHLKLDRLAHPVKYEDIEHLTVHAYAEAVQLSPLLNQ